MLSVVTKVAPKLLVSGLLVTALAACGTPEDAQLATEKLLNEKRIDTLKKGKDSLTRPREVIFWARFKTEQDVPCFETFLTGQQYEVLFKEPRDDKEFPQFVEFSKTLVPTLDTMNAASEALIQAAGTCKGRYQGWEAPVVP